MKLKLPNKIFLGFSAALMLIGLMLVMTREKGFLVCYLSDIRTSEGMKFFMTITKLGEVISYVFLILYFLFRKIKWAISVAFVGILVSALSPLLKYIFWAPRPMNYMKYFDGPCTLEAIPGVESLTGQTSFPSGHTMSAFALMSILSLVLASKKWDLILPVVACGVAISRVYLGHHFLEDITAGAVGGILIALLVFNVFTVRNFERKEWMEKSILDIKLLS